MAENIKFRPAKFDDIPTLMGILAGNNVGSTAQNTAANDIRNFITEYLRHSDDRHMVLVAEMDGKVTGYARFMHFYEKDAIENKFKTRLYEVHIDKDKQQLKLGKALVEEVIKISKEYKNGRQDYIFAQSGAKFKSGNMFLEKCGFKDSGRLASGKTTVYKYDLRETLKEIFVKS